jgi:hypothetical protein
LSLDDLDIRRFQQSMTAPSRVSLEKACFVIEQNLTEMGKIVAHISGDCPLSSDTDRRRLLYLCSCLYDFYLLVEECLLQIARITDRWIPGSLDWHYRLIRLLRAPIPDQRSSVLSGQTASLLEDYLVLFLNYHRHSSVVTAVKLEKMILSLPEVYARLEKELLFLNCIFMPGIR